MRTFDGLPDFPYTLEAQDGEARAGVIETPRGLVHTPCFMPVGTKGTVKAMTPDRLRALGAQIILANTYHLALRPGSDTVKRLGGLHAFMQWDGPILTDSGGYQVFSLRDTAKMDDSGVAFRSIYDGSKHVFTPERAMAEQEALGADFIMCFDQCPPGTATEAEVADAVRRTSLWAERCKVAHQECDGLGTDGPQMLLGIMQGGVSAASAQGHRRASPGDRVSRVCHRRADGGRGPERHARDHVPGDEPAAGRQAALLHGHRRPGGPHRGHRARRGHVRLRASHQDGPHGHGFHAHGQAQHAQRGACVLHRAARSHAAPARPAPGSPGGPSGTSSCRRRYSG